jgi:hypothetical protein
MGLKDGSSVVGDVITIGRKTGQPRRVELRFIYYGGCYYASSTRIQGKHWCMNMVQNPQVKLQIKGEISKCIAKQVTDDALRKKILEVRDSPPQTERVVFEIKPLD